MDTGSDDDGADSWVMLRAGDRRCHTIGQFTPARRRQIRTHRQLTDAVN